MDFIYGIIYSISPSSPSMGAALRLHHRPKRPLANALRRDNIGERFKGGAERELCPPGFLQAISYQQNQGER